MKHGLMLKTVKLLLETTCCVNHLYLIFMVSWLHKHKILYFNMYILSRISTALFSCFCRLLTSVDFYLRFCSLNCAENCAQFVCLFGCFLPTFTMFFKWCDRTKNIWIIDLQHNRKCPPGQRGAQLAVTHVLPCRPCWDMLNWRKSMCVVCCWSLSCGLVSCFWWGSFQTCIWPTEELILHNPQRLQLL